MFFSVDRQVILPTTTWCQDCPHNIPPSGTPCKHNRACFRHHYNHNSRDRSHSYYGSRHRRWFSRSQSCLHSCHDRSSSFRMHTSHSSSSHHSNSCHPSANGCSCYPSPHRYTHPALATSPASTTHVTLLTKTTLTPVTSTIQHKDTNPGKSRNFQDHQPPINPAAPKISPSRILIQTSHQILTVTLIL